MIELMDTELTQHIKWDVVLSAEFQTADSSDAMIFTEILAMIVLSLRNTNDTGGDSYKIGKQLFQRLWKNYR